MIAIIPVDHSDVKLNSPKSTNVNTTHNLPKVEQNNVKTLSVSLCQLRNSTVPVDKNTDVDKPKVSTKFSRFEDSDSDESDEIELTFSKSDSEVEEDAAVNEEPVIEEEEEEEEEFIILEESPEFLPEALPEETKPVRVPSPKKEELARKKTESPSGRNHASESKRTAKSPVRSCHRKTSEPDTGRRKTAESNSRSRSDNKFNKNLKSSERSPPYHRTSEKRREPERPKKSEKQVSSHDRSRKSVLSDSERDRLESRKRKFERTIDPLRIEGKIRLKIGESKEDARPNKDPVIQQTVDDAAHKKTKKTKKSKELKEKRIKNGGSRSVCETNDGEFRSFTSSVLNENI